MAEKTEPKSAFGDMGLGLMFFLLVLVVFIIWVLTGGVNKSTSTESTTITEKEVWPPTNEINSFGAKE